MKVIALERFGQAKVGDIVEVKAGFYRNFLQPFNKAELATAANIKMYEQRADEYAAKEATRLSEANALAEKLREQSIAVSCPATEDGKLYGSITAREIVAGLAAMGVTVSKQAVELPDGPIRTLGEHDIRLRLHADVTLPINVLVSAEST